MNGNNMNHDSRNIRCKYPKRVKTELDSENNVCSKCFEIIEESGRMHLCPECEKEDMREYEDYFWEDLDGTTR